MAVGHVGSRHSGSWHVDGGVGRYGGYPKSGGRNVPRGMSRGWPERTSRPERMIGLVALDSDVVAGVFGLGSLFEGGVVALGVDTLGGGVANDFAGGVFTSLLLRSLI